MIDSFDTLDAAIEEALSKATMNNRAHIQSATMTQEEHDKHAAALAHHASAILHYRNKPENKAILEHVASLIPNRAYINKPLKLESKEAPQIGLEDLNTEHPALKGRADHQAVLDALNNNLRSIHKEFHASPDMKALASHGKRFLSHLSAMLEWHNLQKKGEGAHHQFAGHISGPELEGNYEDSKFRGHSTPSAADRTKFRTQAITKQGGAKWQPASPELTALEEVGGHPSSGKIKELYPFHEIKVNKEPLALKEFKEEEAPEELKTKGFKSNPIHDQDYATNLTTEHKVKTPSGEVVDAMGGYHGAKGSERNMDNMTKVGIIKKSTESGVCSYFPEATVAHIVLAKSFMGVMNPYASMTDEDFGDYVVHSINKNLGPSEQAGIIVESQSRLEKAGGHNVFDAKAWQRGLGARRIHDRVREEGIGHVLAGKITPLPLPDEEDEVIHRTKKEDEERDELQDVNAMRHFVGSATERKRSPFAVPKEVFTDDTYSKVDPKKYREYVDGKMNEDDLRREHASYGTAIRYNPKTQARHDNYIELHRKSKGKEEELAKPVAEHRSALVEAGKALAAGKMTPQEFAELNAKGMKHSKEGSKGKIAAAELTPEEQRVKGVDPSFQPKRPGVSGKAEASSEKDLTELARGKMPTHMIPDRDEGGASEAQAKEMMGGGGKDPDDEREASGSMTPEHPLIRLINDHPGFKAYFKLKENLMSHYKDPAVRKYMEDKVNLHENNPNLDVDKLAATFHFLHRSKNQADKISVGQKKLMGDIASGQAAPEAPAAAEEAPGKGTALSPESMMTPEQTGRLQQVRQEKGTVIPPVKDVQAAVMARPTGLKTDDPSYKAKIMAEIQAKEDAKKPK